MSNSNRKNGIIYLDFVGVSKNGTYVYHNPIVSPPKRKPDKNDNVKTIFEEYFKKKK